MLAAFSENKAPKFGDLQHMAVSYFALASEPNALSAAMGRVSNGTHCLARCMQWSEVVP